MRLCAEFSSNQSQGGRPRITVSFGAVFGLTILAARTNLRFHASGSMETGNQNFKWDPCPLCAGYSWCTNLKIM
jgi:hypothetical protein